MSKEIFNALELLEKEKGIPKDYMLEKISQALLTAYKRDHDGASENVVVEPDLAKRELKMYVQKTVVEDIEDPETEITLADAHDYARAPQIGDVVNIESAHHEFRTHCRADSKTGNYSRYPGS